MNRSLLSAIHTRKQRLTVEDNRSEDGQKSQLGFGCANPGEEVAPEEDEDAVYGRAAGVEEHALEDGCLYGGCRIDARRSTVSTLLFVNSHASLGLVIHQRVMSTMTH